MKTPISMRLDEELVAAAKEAAAAEHRSLANFVEVALADRISRRSESRRMTVTIPEGSAALRGASVVSAPWEGPDDIARAQSVIDRLLDIAAASENDGSAAADPGATPKPKTRR